MSNLSDKPWLIPGHMYQYDIGWLVDKLLSFETELNTAIDLKTIHYADPIQWDITTQYSPNTVVVDPKTGTAYMSKVPVPAGVLLTNTDYWVVIFNYQRIYDKIMSGVAFNDKDNLNATKDLLVNDLVWYGGDLYRCTRAIPQGTTYIPGTNLTPTTIADCLATYYGRDRVAHLLNDTLSVSGDYTINAGDISRTASHITDHATVDYQVDADGKYTATIAGNREIEVAGDDIKNIGGNKNEIVNGVTNVTYKNTKIANLTAEEKNADDVTYNVKNGYSLSANEAIITLKEHLFNVIFDDKKINLYYTLYDFVNVKDYGAVGDGITDDTDAFKAAMTAGNVYVPSGKYVVTGLTGAKVVLSNGEIVSDLALTNYRGKLIGGKYKSLNLSECDCELTNLIVDNTSNALTATNSKIVLESCSFKGGDNCVLLKNCINSIIDNIFVEAVKQASEEIKLHCIQLNECTNCKITSSFALNANWFGFSIYNSFKCTITDCISYNSYAEGINFENTNSSILSNNLVSWDDNISNDYGISLFGNNDKSANLNVVSGNLIYNCKQSGIAVDGNAHSNQVFGNNIINCNSQNSVRNAAITSAKLEGYTGQPGNNYFHDNLILPSTHTTGLYDEMNALSKNYVNNNFSTIPLNIGNYGSSVIGSNIGVDTINFNSTSSNGQITESFIVGITPVIFMISATINVTVVKETQITIPYKTNSLVFGCAFDAVHNIAIQAFGHDNVISFTPVNNGIHYIRAIVSLANR